MTDAKPCPFCGSKDIELFDYPFRSIRGLKGCFAHCMACGARGGNYATVEDALKAWNERTDSNE